MLSEEQRKPLIRVYEAIIQSPHSAIAINEIILVKKLWNSFAIQRKEKEILVGLHLLQTITPS